MVTSVDHLALVVRVERMERWLGTAPETSNQGTVFRCLSEMNESLEALRKSMWDQASLVETRISYCDDEISALTQAVDLKVEGLLDDMQLVKRTLRTVEARSLSSKAKVLKPKPFEGARSSKELENLLWDMETYFKAAHFPDNEMVSITSMYLTGDAKLWWSSRLTDDASANRPAIETWENLKKELKDQFLPCNTSFLARDALRKLKNSGSVREYVKEFSSLMLDVRDMSDEDKLFNFLSVLQAWAQAELKRQGVKDLQSVIAAADSLIDYKTVGANKSGQRKKDLPKGKEKEKKGKAGWKGKKKFGESGSGSSKESNQPAGEKKRGCFICNGDHRMRDCPKKGKLNALVAESDGEKEVNGPRVNPLQLLTAIQGDARVRNGLMYVKVVVNGKEVMAMVDSGATHNFVADRMVGKLGLDLTPHSSRIKAVNSEVKPIQGVSDVLMELGTWKGICSLMAVPLDDFEVILGMEFLKLVKAAVFPHVGGLLILDEGSPTFVKGEYLTERKSYGLISALQLKKGLKQGVPMYLAAVVEIKPGVSQEVSDSVAELLQEFKDVFPSERRTIRSSWSQGCDHPHRPLIGCHLQSWRS